MRLVMSLFCQIIHCLWWLIKCDVGCYLMAKEIGVIMVVESPTKI